MDKNQNQEEQRENQQQKSAVERLNEAAQKARQAKTAIEAAKKGKKVVKGAAKTLRTASTVLRGGQAAIAVASGVVATAPVWGPPVLIGGFFLLVIIIIIVIFSGVSAPPTCKSITAEPKKISNNLPSALTLEGCSENVTYLWELPSIGGVFSTPQSAITLYTPPSINETKKISIGVKVCFSSNANNCSIYQTPQLTIESGQNPIYPGITYNLTGPGCSETCNAEKGKPIVYNVDIEFNEDEADVTLDKVSAAVTLSTAVFTINNVTGVKTAQFNPNIPLVKYIWKLSDNVKSSEKNSKIKNFHFEIKATPYVDKTQTSVRLTIEGATAQPPKDNTDVSYWGKQIANALEPYPKPCPSSGNTLYNVLRKTVTNGNYTAYKRPGDSCGDSGSAYLCTYIIVDSYRLAKLKTKLTIGRDGYTWNMVDHWEENPGWQILRVNNFSSLSKIKAGDAIFSFDTPTSRNSKYRHVKLIKSVKINPISGNGTIYSYQSNGYGPETSNMVRAWRVLPTEHFDVFMFGAIP